MHLVEAHSIRLSDVHGGLHAEGGCDVLVLGFLLAGRVDSFGDLAVQLLFRRGLERHLASEHDKQEHT